MNKELSKIKISNTYFFNGEELNVFKTEKNDVVVRATLIFGKNGSGKSTVINLINNFKNHGNNDTDYINFYDDNDGLINDKILTDNIHCFNEEFIDKNVKVLVDGLQTIIMLGEQIDVDKEIKSNSFKLETLEEELEKVDISKYQLESSTDCPGYYYDKIKKALLQPNGWAEMDRDIKGNKKKSKVTDDVVKNIASNKNSLNVNNLVKAYDEKMSYYSKVKDKTEALDENIIEVDLEDDLSEINKQLYSHISKPLGDEYTDRLTKTLNDYGNDRLLEMNMKFKNKPDYCPYCLRNISEDEIKIVLESIKTLQNRDVKDFELKLQNLFITEHDIDKYNQYIDVDKEIVDKITEDLMALNKKINIINDNIKKRLNDIFTIPDKQDLGFSKLISKINKNIGLLKEKIVDFNSDVKNSKALKDELSTLAMKIAYHNIQTDLLTMNQKEENYKKDQEKVNNLKEQIEHINERIRKLEGKKSRTDIAESLINDFLTVIFYDEDRLKIVHDNGKYVVYSFGKIVPPNKLSTGERNAIALCYFFTTINNNINKDSVFKKPLLIGIDDPVTSFDVDNRIGIFSFLRSMFYRIFTGNQNSKVLILTHKIDVFYDLCKTLNDAFSGKNKELNTFEIKNKQLIKFNIESTYKCLLKEVFDFATNTNPSDSEVRSIGNIMRRVMESFSHFNYSLDINKITNEEKILEKIENERLRDYFRDFMHRLLLNNESHMRDTVSSIETNAYYQYVNVEEKRKTAKSLLVFLYQLDSFHITQNLKGSSSVELSIRQWINEITRKKS
jgi:ABC-type lipoprotein export system ATPase subunit